MVFARAAASAPCVIFFDELDALCPSRSNDSESQSSSRLVNTLLTEMDGMQGRKQVYVIAATNRPDMIDPAMLRPGRLDKTLYVDLPDEQERFEILKTLTRNTPLNADVDLMAIARDVRCDGYSGADLAALVRESAVTALRATIYIGGRATGAILDASLAGEITVSQSHFMASFAKIPPSVGKRDRKRYELLKIKFGSATNGSTVTTEEEESKA
jgi:ribosome biogenesis ATPase